MADVAVPYTLTTPGGTIVFNDANQTDQYFITEINGLEGTDIRAPIDAMPFGHGGLGHNFWEAHRQMLFDGFFRILSVHNCNAEVVIRNDMEEDLRVALRSIAADTGAVGTLVWTPQGQSQRTLEVRHHIRLDCPHDSSYIVRLFHFGLVAEIPDWDGWSS